MKALYKINQKRKPALLMLVVVVLVLCCSFLEERLFRDMNASVTSIYKDRLVPAGSLFHINDLMYAKRMLLESHLQRPGRQDAQRLKQQLARYNTQIDSIIDVYENTYLVAEEEQTFAAFKSNVKQFNQLEKALLPAGMPAAATAENEQKLLQLFDEIHHELVLLSDIQTHVGQELMEGSKTINGSAALISILQIAVILIIAATIYHLLLIDRHPLVPKQFKNFHMN